MEQTSQRLARLRALEAAGFQNVRQQRPQEGCEVDYDLIFLGQRISGHKRLESPALEADEALNPVDAALLLGAGPGIESAYWRPHDDDEARGDAVS